MADKLNENNEQSFQPSTNRAEGSAHLEGFIASQILQQEKASRESDNLDPTKRDNFIARALSESHRMSMEAEKSRRKAENLHDELGEERMEQWSNEHSAEVLHPQQTNPANLSYQHG
ncbi:hypothetical protein BsWGS_18692 [Bradybaena similaris]